MTKKERGKGFFISEMKAGPIKSAEDILGKCVICDSCLGRQFGQISTGMTNKQRGCIIRGMLKEGPLEGTCEICEGLFQGGIREWSGKAVKRLQGLEYRSFVVGSRLSRDLVRNEEKLWGMAGISHCEPMKTEVNRELGKLICKKTGKDVDELRPDVVLLLDLTRNEIRLQVNSLFIYGEYQKLVRGIPQTKWETYKTSVEDEVARPVMKATRGSGHSFHGSGREDVDALCLGWRPFVLEITEPRKRRINLRKMLTEMNRSKKVNVRKLRYSDRKEVAALKSSRNDKKYRLLVQFEKPCRDEELKKLKNLIGMIKQRTPERVLHRRSDLLRKRRVKSLVWRRVSNKRLEIEIKGEAGLYVKELMTGDNGRTEPSVSGVLGNKAKVVELDVIKIEKVE
ncbi:MAG: tRNA pseudouridine(54/55) synthase Pus10 [Candidatus Aenigmatarchaeota archaeon]|nr:MAG: tRNA pseudouridine(54/55) synthase Pus10 [Candidatus Aenigmarchaeota archaeon]